MAEQDTPRDIPGSSRPHEPRGVLAYLDVRECCHPYLRSHSDLHVLLLKACNRAGATVLGANTYQAGDGVTAFAVLLESHAAIHTYPEHGVYLADAFACGTKVHAETILDLIKHELGGIGAVRCVMRGFSGLVQPEAGPVPSPGASRFPSRPADG